ncbi:hypothetical protein [Phormidesmis sp. 146-33]
MNCSSDCDQGNCPFVSDPQRSTRYVCLKCGLERDIENDVNPARFILLLLALPLVITLLMSQRPSPLQPDAAPTESPSP